MAVTGFKLEDFTGSFKGGARANLFLYTPLFPSGIGSKSSTRYLVKSTSLPDTTIDEVLVNWQGYDYKMAGKYTFADFTVTFNVDAQSEIIRDFNRWMQKIHNVDTNEYSAPSIYMVNQNIQLLGYDGNVILEYELHDAWPKTMSAITLDYATADVATFDIGFSYQYHTIKGTETGG